jgi:hypothetical protein
MFVLLLYRLVMPWLNMSIAIGSETIIANGVAAPIRMASFPSMETLQPEWFTDQPDIARSQIEILVTNETDVFDTIPDVTVRNHYWCHYHRWRSHIHRLWSHIHWSRSRNYYWLERYLPIWLNYTA